MNLLGSFKKILQETKATTAIEFALVFPIYFFLLVGFVEFGIMMYGNALLDSTLTRASRRAMVGCMEGNCDAHNIVDNIVKEIEDASFGFILEEGGGLGGNLRIAINTVDASNISMATNYSVASEIDDDKLEEVLDLGDGGDIVSYCLEYDWNDIFPITPSDLVYGLPAGVMTFRTCTVIRNEEYGYQIRGL